MLMIGQTSTFQKDSTDYMKCTSTIRSTYRTTVLRPSTETGSPQIRCVLPDNRPRSAALYRWISKIHNVVAFYNDTMKILLTLSDFKLLEAHAPYVVIFVRLLGWSSLQHPPKAPVLFAPMITSSFQGGQAWTSMSKMRLQFRNGFKKHEPQVFEIITFPKFGIGQRAFLIQTLAVVHFLWDKKWVVYQHENVAILLVLKSSTGLMELKRGVFYSWEISYWWGWTTKQ
ncbi:hypothetical protein SELMODRAFT_421993 [Selaginella moellendorffii]|uniref:Uncharacterized protein n=1 Tax=Selaginella moellendorffii TaxID=88036 RepID=D8SH02_SELML|nr:hypothetical protein SELMODRAFT_421993 [Selaginella moellendorffii]